MNETCYLTGVRCGLRDKSDIKGVTKYIVAMQEISPATLLQEKYRMYQKFGESPEDFLVRWNSFLMKSEVLGVDMPAPYTLNSDSFDHSKGHRSFL